MSDGSAPKTSVRLSPREIEVAGMVAEGLTNAQVANRLHLSEHTVAAHLRSIFGKIGVSSRVNPSLSRKSRTALTTA